MEFISGRIEEHYASIFMHASMIFNGFFYSLFYIPINFAAKEPTHYSRLCTNKWKLLHMHTHTSVNPLWFYSWVFCWIESKIHSLFTSNIKHLITHFRLFVLHDASAIGNFLKGRKDKRIYTCYTDACMHACTYLLKWCYKKISMNQLRVAIQFLYFCVFVFHLFSFSCWTKCIKIFSTKNDM